MNTEATQDPFSHTGSSAERTPPTEREFPCAQCGGKLKFKPGTAHLVCPYCATPNDIPESASGVEENDFAEQISTLEREAELVERVDIVCQACAAHVQLPDNVTSSKCPFCATPIVATGKSIKQIKPQAILPFQIDDTKARQLLTRWIAERWFAPNALKANARVDAGVQGVYVPYWTYDCSSTTHYTGQRGDNYTTTETVTVMVNGRPQQRTQQVVRTRWSPASGTVFNAFDDILVCASHSISTERLAELTPWDLKAVVPYRDEYLSGFRAETYFVDLKGGFGIATQMIQPRIDVSIRRDIGGDQQMISSKRSSYSKITYKHVLLPIWVCAYRWNNKPYQILINATTGEIHGDRPYSAWKIALLVLAIAVVIGLIALLANR